MAISTSFLPFRSPSRNTSSSFRGNQTKALESQLGKHEPDSIHPNLPTHDQARKIKKENKSNLFTRVSLRFSKARSNTNTFSGNPVLQVEPNSELTRNYSLPSKARIVDPLLQSLPEPSPPSPFPSEFGSRKPIDLQSEPSVSLSGRKNSLSGLQTNLKCDPESPASARTHSRSSLSFWKRMSLSTSSHVDDHDRKAELADGYTNDSDMIQTSLSSDGHPSSILSSELSETVSSTVDTNETSVECLEEIDEEDECGMAGIGVRNRRSVYLHSLPIRAPLDPKASPTGVVINKPINNPAMRYAPSCSSPLSSRSQSPSELAASLSMRTSCSTTRSSSRLNHSGLPSAPRQSRTLGARRSSYGRLNLVPHQSFVGSQDLIKILRGPSSYPEETLPGASNRHLSYVCV